MAIDPGTFREAMSRFPSGVTIVTTIDGFSNQWGFTASTFASLSLDPPLVLVCLDRSANCYTSFCETDRFAINILGADHEAVARRFATKGINKFAGLDFQPGEFRLPLFTEAVAALECEKSELLPGGDHVILIGRPLTIRLGSGAPAVLFNKRFWRFLEAAGVPANGAGAGAPAGLATRPHAESVVVAERQ